TQEADCRKLVEAGVDMVFLPSVSEMYPSGQVQTLVKAPDMLTTVLEGAQRPGHFDGVTTVVSKLFNIVQPDVAVFGQKDFQQWRVIQQMAADLSMPIEIIRAPIERDRDGLALSSRNQYLTAEQRQVAPKLFVTLQDVKAAVLSGNTAYSQLESAAVQQLLESGFDRVDYVKIVSQQQLSPAGPEDAKLVILAVARLGATRLLDNIALTLTGENT
ncbi:MAG: pantoate--beta-alanine ligase, partial [Hydrogenovibrio sp.]|nr:pantoate--beta-alanine ligase [Hydrogenovibrio sp.]